MSYLLCFWVCVILFLDQQKTYLVSELKEEAVTSKNRKEEGVEETVQLLEKSAIAGLSEFTCHHVSILYQMNHPYSVASFTELLLCLGKAYQALMKYDLGRAVRTFQSLPPHHWETPWVLGQVARAYFAAERFEQVSWTLG
jgi:hypothetical protein